MERIALEFLIRSALIAGAAGGVLRVLEIRRAAARHAVWAGVLALMPLLPLWIAWGPKATLPVLAEQSLPAVVAQAGPADTAGAAAPRTTPAAPAAPLRWNWREAWIGVYLLGAGALLLRLAFGVARAAKLTAAECVAPVTVGLFRPRVILPENCSDWPPTKLEAVLAHEGAHARRRDPLVQFAALANRALFWFHPLAWWLERQLSALAEEACDAEVLAQGHDARDYSEYLLQLARAVRQAGMRVNLAGMSMPGSRLPQRIGKIVTGTGAGRLPVWRLVGAVAACAVCSAALATGTLGHVPMRRVPLPVAAAVQAAPAAPPPAPAPQHTDRPAGEYVTALGSAVPFQTVEVKSRIDGQLMSVSFQEGQAVQAGQLLATIDPRPYELPLTQARTELSQDEAMLDASRTELTRKMQARANQLIPEDEVAAARAQVAGIEARIKMDQANLQAAELQISYTRILSPITGLAGLRRVDVGNMVHASDAAGIVNIAQIQPMAVLFQIPEDDVPAARARLGSGTAPAVEAWNREQTARIAVGRLMAVDNQIDVQTGTAKLKAVFDNKDGALFPNQFVMVRLMLGR